MIYLDNCATTKMRREVKDALIESMDLDFGNPSSLHRLGLNSEKKIKEARAKIGKYLRVKPGEIYFTSGGTESNNLIIQSVIKGSRQERKHVITSKIEHSSITNVLESYGDIDITYLDCNEYGQVDLKQLEESIRENTILVAIIHVNNEIGTVQDIRAIRKIIGEKSKDIVLHLDGVQSFGKIDFSLKALGVDTFSFSGHKVHGPKGIGGIYIREGLNIRPLIYGGMQEKGLRSGTENVQGIIAMAKAVEILDLRGSEERKHVEGLRDYFIGELKREIDDIRINTPLEVENSPYILNISFRNTRGEVLLHYLEDKGIYVSTASACTSNGTKKSHVLKNIGLDHKDMEGAIRICFSYETSKEDLDFTIRTLRDSVEEIRKIIMR